MTVHRYSITTVSFELKFSNPQCCQTGSMFSFICKMNLRRHLVMNRYLKKINYMWYFGKSIVPVCSGYLPCPMVRLYIWQVAWVLGIEGIGDRSIASAHKPELVALSFTQAVVWKLACLGLFSLLLHELLSIQENYIFVHCKWSHVFICEK